MADDKPTGTVRVEAPDSFSRPPPEVTRYFEAKGIKPSFHWLDIAFDEHATAFTVARSAGFDILGDVRAAVAKAIEERQDFGAFKAGLEPLLKAKGWWGKAETVDPTSGETVKSQLGSTRRLETIFNANVRTAFAAGQWERQWRTRRVLPFLLYLISTAEHKRPLHLSWVGTILPIDHPWWDTHYPPNGWNCQCRVRQISDVEAERRGYDPKAEPPEDGFVQFFNKRSGEYVKVPRGIDPGWASNPGKTRTKNVADLLAGRLDDAPADARRVAVEDIVADPLVQRIAEGRTGFDPENREDQGNVAKGRIAMPVAVLTPELRDAVGAETSVVRLSVADGAKQARKRRVRAIPSAPAEPDATQTPSSSAPVARPAPAVAAGSGALSVHAPDYAKVQRLIDGGEVIRQGEHDLVFQGLIDGKLWVAVLRRAAKAVTEIYLKSFRRQEERQSDVYRRRGTVLRHPRHLGTTALEPKPIDGTSSDGSRRSEQP